MQTTHRSGASGPAGREAIRELSVGALSLAEEQYATVVSDVSMDRAAMVLESSKLDPDSLLMQMQLRMRDAGVERAESGIELNQSRAEHQKLMQEVALKKAEEAGGFLGLSGPLGDVLKAVVVIATTVAAAVCTGGVGAGLAIAGAALILCAKPVTHVAVELGVVSEEDASKFQLGVELVGAALTLGSGIVGGGAAAGSSAANVVSSAANGAAAGAQVVNVGAQTAEAIKTVAETVKTVTQVLQAANGAAASVVQRIQTGYLLDGEEAGEEVEYANVLTDNQVALIKEIFAQSSRSHEQLERIRKERAEAQMATLREW